MGGHTDMERALINDSRHQGEAPAHAPGVAQARALQQQAGRGGLIFEAYLPPVLASWLLGEIARGVFDDPNTAISIVLAEYRELEPHADLRRELLQRTIQAALADPQPPIAASDVAKQLQAPAPERQPEPAVWQSTR